MEWLPKIFIFGLPGLCLVAYLFTVSRLYLRNGKPVGRFLAVCGELLSSRYGKTIRVLGLLYFLAAVVIVAGINIFGHAYFAATGEQFSTASLQRPAIEFIVDYAIPLSFLLLIISLLRGAHHSGPKQLQRLTKAIQGKVKQECRQKPAQCWMVVASELMLGGALISLIMAVWYIMKQLLEVECVFSALFQ